jgi:hypothetical protein
VAQIEGYVGLAAAIGQPVVGVSGFTSNSDLIFERFDCFLKLGKIVFKVFVQHNLTGFVHDADLTAPGMNVDAGIVIGMNVTVTHKRPSFFISNDNGMTRQRQAPRAFYAISAEISVIKNTKECKTPIISTSSFLSKA